MSRIAIVGAGRMGIPMAQALAAAGFNVDVADMKERTEAEWTALRTRAATQWEANTTLLAEFRRDAMAPEEVVRSITFRRGYGPWLQSVDCLFEALPENLEIKRAAYEELGCWLKPDCVVGSTTSTLTPDELAGALPHPERFMVTHWLYPAWIMPLVEVAPGSATAAPFLEGMLGILRQVRKIPVVLAGRPGLVVPRLQVMIMNEAARMVEEGLGTTEEIDRAARLGLGIRFLVLGLLEFADCTGLDTLFHASCHLRRSLDDPKFDPAPGVLDRLNKGQTGKRTGHGFLEWSSSQVEAHETEVLQTYLRVLQFLGLL